MQTAAFGSRRFRGLSLREDDRRRGMEGSFLLGEERNARIAGSSSRSSSNERRERFAAASRLWQRRGVGIDFFGRRAAAEGMGRSPGEEAESSREREGAAGVSRFASAGVEEASHHLREQAERNFFELSRRLASHARLANPLSSGACLATTGEGTLLEDDEGLLFWSAVSNSVCNDAAETSLHSLETVASAPFAVACGEGPSIAASEDAGLSGKSLSSSGLLAVANAGPLPAPRGDESQPPEEKREAEAHASETRGPVLSAHCTGETKKKAAAGTCWRRRPRRQSAAQTQNPPQTERGIQGQNQGQGGGTVARGRGRRPFRTAASQAGGFVGNETSTERNAVTRRAERGARPAAARGVKGENEITLLQNFAGEDKSQQTRQPPLPSSSTAREGVGGALCRLSALKGVEVVLQRLGIRLGEGVHHCRRRSDETKTALPPLQTEAEAEAARGGCGWVSRKTEKHVAMPLPPKALATSTEETQTSTGGSTRSSLPLGEGGMRRSAFALAFLNGELDPPSSSCKALSQSLAFAGGDFSASPTARLLSAEGIPGEAGQRAVRRVPFEMQQTQSLYSQRGGGCPAGAVFASSVTPTETFCEREGQTTSPLVAAPVAGSALRSAREESQRQIQSPLEDSEEFPSVARKALLQKATRGLAGCQTQQSALPPVDFAVTAEGWASVSSSKTKKPCRGPGVSAADSRARGSFAVSEGRRSSSTEGEGETQCQLATILDEAEVEAQGGGLADGAASNKVVASAILAEAAGLPAQQQMPSSVVSAAEEGEALLLVATRQRSWLTPAEVLARHGGELTPWERLEATFYKRIYYWGARRTRPSGRPAAEREGNVQPGGRPRSCSTSSSGGDGREEAEESEAGREGNEGGRERRVLLSRFHRNSLLTHHHDQAEGDEEQGGEAEADGLDGGSSTSHRASNFCDADGNYIGELGDHLAFRYELLQALGAGAFGRVFKCLDHKRRELVAVKIIRNDPPYHKQGMQEIGALRRLIRSEKKAAADAPSSAKPCSRVVRLLDYFKFRGHIVLVLELLGSNLYDFMRQRRFGGFCCLTLRSIGIQLLQALEQLRLHRIVHCDLKPENVTLVSSSRTRVKVVDLGSCCNEGEQPFRYIQSRYYRAPEVILGLKYNSAIDVWSLGCLLAELRTRKPLFPGVDEHDQLLRITSVLGEAPRKLVERSPRAKQFYDRNFRLRREVPHATYREAARCEFRRPCLTPLPLNKIFAQEASFAAFLSGEETRGVYI